MMSLEAALTRIAQIESLLSPPAPAAPAAPATSPSGSTATSFASTLQSAMSPDILQAAAPVNGATAGSGAGNAIVQIAQSQVGQAEQPPGSNDGPAISTYRTATAGAAPGEPWCAYFVSWVARQAGEPIGSQGQGLGYVGDIWSWAQQTSRAIPNGPGVTPQPGDLIVFGNEHVGIVKQVLPNGSIETIEGNYDNQVSQVIRSPTEATGYVRM
jgi:hypothetical protein